MHLSQPYLDEEDTRKTETVKGSCRLQRGEVPPTKLQSHKTDLTFKVYY